ncbi:MAG TPA: hypothetical protein VFA43_04400 [Gemmatimonadaceae bacterium]|nr:hypothetical protein [Gemmatimonadaceae bacterium]
MMLVTGVLVAVTLGGTAGPAPYVSSRHAAMPAGLATAVEVARNGVPSFSRQTGLACSACHYQFPQLTPFGRLFKLNGYSLFGVKAIVEPDKSKGAGLNLIPFPPLSLMWMTSTTSLAKKLPGTQNDATEFPQQFSLFLAGSLTPHVGALIQATYEGSSGTFGIDNSDIRFVNHFRLAGSDLLFGVTAHNNPTAQDVWNTTPAWGYPFASADATPGSLAASMIDGGLAQQVLGVGAYALWNNMLYLEGTGYRSAQQGAPVPLDSTATGAINGITPYWRAALQHQFGTTFYGMVGTYGLSSRQFLGGVSGATNTFTDLGFDSQLERPTKGGGAAILRATWIHEWQRLDAVVAESAPGAANVRNHLNTVRVNATYEPNARYGGTIGYFSTDGSRDTVLYAPAAVFGSGSGRPRTTGTIEELDFNPWENTRLAVQAIQFTQFNGSGRGYDGFGRNAWNNNTLYLMAWIAF